MEEFRALVTPASNKNSFQQNKEKMTRKSDSHSSLQTLQSSDESTNSLTPSPAASPVISPVTAPRSSNFKGGWAKIKKEFVVNKNSGDTKKKYDDALYLSKSPLKSPTIGTKNNKESFTNAQRSTIKILVLGEDGVGKSAFVVRYLTGKYIGEYDPWLEGIFKRKKIIKSHEANIEIKDTVGGINWLKRAKDLIWADVILFLYSTTNRKSFIELQKLTKLLTVKHLQRHLFMLVGNKKDLSHQREVSSHEGYSLAQTLNASFIEVSVAEEYKDIEIHMNKLLVGYLVTNQASKQALLQSKSTPDIKQKGSDISTCEINNNLTQDSNFLTVGYASYHNSSNNVLTDSEDNKNEKRGRALWQKLRSSSDVKKTKK